MSNQKTHWKKFFNYDYLGAYSLPEGKDMILTIKRTATEKVKGTGGKEQNCFVIYFEEAGSKPMILNRTNSKTIEKIYSPWIEDWIGCKIQLFVKDKVSAFGSEVDALRIRDFKPKIKTPEEIELEGVRAKVRAALAKYKGDDRAAIIAEMKKKPTDIIFLNQALKKIS